MDRNSEEFESMGICAIYREAYKVTVSWKKIFSHIAFTLILPLAIIFQVQIEISALLVIKFNQIIDEYQTGNSSYANILQAHISSEIIILYASKAICWIFICVLSLLSTSAVVYTIGCIYSAKDVTFKKVRGAVPKVWKRLVITFLWNLLIVLFIFSLAQIFTFKFDVKSTTGIIISEILMVFIFIPYLIGAMYISLVWYIASVTAILEDISGIAAMKKGKDLLQGKLWISFFTYITLQICYSGTLSVFSLLVVHGHGELLLVMFLHFGLVIQTIIYFVCKSHHKESIDKSSLADHLDGYHHGDYVPLSSNENAQPAGAFV
ncbi:hypothetical protein MKW98_014300 [Papaver atlanticum]|uniref:Uncharacterized protein n=1 Tax=Papaver atlanticum TaxID=357466 RepID=A0AAD4XMV6_9MAGN|nr:hypothetical protein MKW98_014300 [Papaver atlanticum]